MSAHLLAYRLQRDLGLLNADVINFKVCNVVCSFGLGYRLNLHKLTKEQQLQSVWNPDEFRGTTWRFGGVSFVLFETGLAVVTGAKTFEKLKEAYESAKVILKEYKQEEGDHLTTPRRISRGKAERERFPIAKRKREIRDKSYKKHEQYYVQSLREKDKKPVVPLKRPVAKKQRKASGASAIETNSVKGPETSFRWKAIDSRAPLMMMTATTTTTTAAAETTSTAAPPTETLMIPMDVQFLPLAARRI